MARKVILDCDPGIDDAAALAMALFHERLEVVAITAVAGNVHAAQATRNVQAVVERLDPPRYPRIGAAVDHDTAPEVDNRRLLGDDGLANTNYEVSQLVHRHASEKILCDEIRAASEQVTLVALGPLTNVARALSRDPGLVSQMGRIVMMGGSVSGIGNATAAAEFNMHYDPASAQAVFRSRTTKTLIPLDVTSQVVFTFDIVDALPPESTRAGALLRRLLGFAFRANHQQAGREDIYLHDVVALLAVTNPELFTMREMHGDVETRGELTAGATVFDRRPRPAEQPNMEVAVEIDVAAARDAILRAFSEAGRQT